jgi:hypothetical protein
MGQQDYWPLRPIRGKGSIQCYGSDIAERSLGRTHDEGAFNGIRGGRIPDRDPELVSVPRVTQARRFLRSHPVCFANRLSTYLCG